MDQEKKANCCTEDCKMHLGASTFNNSLGPLSRAGPHVMNALCLQCIFSYFQLLFQRSTHNPGLPFNPTTDLCFSYTNFQFLVC